MIIIITYNNIKNLIKIIHILLYYNTIKNISKKGPLYNFINLILI